MKLKNLTKKDFFLITIIIIFVIILINITIFKIYWIPSGSMEKTIMENDFTYVYQLPYMLNIASPEYGEILVFKEPLNKKYVYVKRLLGKPGDSIFIKDNKVFRNNKEIKEPYLKNPIIMEDYGPVSVPEKSYFFMGDNRVKSLDSREWGFVDYSLIKGKVISVIWPLERAGELK